MTYCVTLQKSMLKYSAIHCKCCYYDIPNYLKNLSCWKTYLCILIQWLFTTYSWSISSRNTILTLGILILDMAIFFVKRFKTTANPSIIWNSNVTIRKSQVDQSKLITVYSLSFWDIHEPSRGHPIHFSPQIMDTGIGSP